MTTTTKTATGGADAGVQLPHKGTEPDTATVTDYCKCGHAPYAHEEIVTSDSKCLIYRCDCLNYQHHAEQPSDPAESSRLPQLDYHVADNADKPAVLLIRAYDGSDYEGQTLGVFPLGSEDYVAEIAKRSNTHTILVAALERAENAIRGAHSLRSQLDCTCKSKSYVCVTCGIVDELSRARAVVGKALKQARGGE